MDSFGRGSVRASVPATKMAESSTITPMQPMVEEITEAPLNDEKDSKGLLSDLAKLARKDIKRRAVICTILVLVALCSAFIILFAAAYNQECSEDNTTTKANETSKVLSTTPETTVSTRPVQPEPDYGPGPWRNTRIPSYIKPHHYDLKLIINVDESKLDGNVVVNLSLTQETPYLYLHVKELNYTYPKITKNGESIKMKRLFYYKPSEFLVMEAAEKIFGTGIYEIEMQFGSTLMRQLHGLYKSTYHTKEGNEVTIVTSQLKVSDARAVFPCFDEPALKATFSIIIVRPTKMISLSNMPQIRNEEIDDKMIADYYEKTPLMSTYLLAFIVCDYDYLQEYAGAKYTPLRFYAPKYVINQAEYAKSIARTMFEFYEKYFSISYPLSKADMIAIPDFIAGGMENWGLIVYQEAALLFQKGISTERDRSIVATTISHELSHMWFGNLVTPEWWNHFWLSEGFGRYMEYIGVNTVHPDWKMNDWFVNAAMAEGFSLDASALSHPLLQPVENPKHAIAQIFDTLTYSKGASIIRMLEHFLTKEVFMRGLRNFLMANQYGSMKTKDFWKYLTEASTIADTNIDVAKVMNTWTLQMGFPVVNVAGVNNSIVLTQKRFFADPNANAHVPSTYGYRWHIPFTMHLGSIEDEAEVKTTDVIWLDKKTDKTIVPRTWDLKKQWLKGNVGQTGFYRVNYPEENWDLLAKQLQYNHSIFSLGDKSGLILDAFALANAGQLDYKYALNLTRYLEKETNYIPWDAGHSSLSELASSLSRFGHVYKKLQKYWLKLIKPNFQRLGVDNWGGHLDKRLRLYAVRDACSAGDQECLTQVKELFDKWIRDESYPMQPVLRSTIYFHGIAMSGEEEWDILYERYQKSEEGSESKLEKMLGLAGTSQPWILNRYLQYAFNETKVRKQDMFSLINFVADKNPVGRHFVWNFLKGMWPTILEQYGNGFDSQSSMRIILSVTSGFRTQWEIKELEDLFRIYPKLVPATKARQYVVKKVQDNIRWKAIHEPQIKEWLASG